MLLEVTQANMLLTLQLLRRVPDWINPLTFPSRRGGSNLPDSVAAAGGSAPDDISRCAPSVRGQLAPWGGGA